MSFYFNSGDGKTVDITVVYTAIPSLYTTIVDQEILIFSMDHFLPALKLFSSTEPASGDILCFPLISTGKQGLRSEEEELNQAH